MPLFSRRNIILTAGIAPAALLLKHTPALAISGGTFVRPKLIARVKAALDLHATRIVHRDVIAIADFAAPSHRPRFHFVNLENGQTTTFLVAHGRGSDPTHSGYLQHFSNLPGSFETANGAYVTDDIYSGKHGQSRRLIGLEAANDQAENRAIVIHSAWYVSAAVAQETGKLGRSEGCFAVAECDHNQVLEMLGPGRLLFADKV